MVRYLPLLFACIFPLVGFSQQPHNVAHTVYLVGDAGEHDILQQHLGDALRAAVKQSGANTTVLFLGDNIYPKGMPSAGAGAKRQESEEIIQQQVDWVKDLPAKAIFIPGNHDWQKGRRNGMDQILRQQAWIDSLKNVNISMLPGDACPGPVEVPLADGAVLVIMDTQWFLHPWDKQAGSESPCAIKSGAEAWIALGDILTRNANKRVIVAAHHPLITHGEHGGVFTVKDHIFPFTAVADWAYLPMPGVGSIYPLYRKWFGDVQDVAHPLYKGMIGLIQAQLEQFPGTIYAAGHEHGLQYLVKDSVHMVVSGSGSKTSFVKKKQYSKLAEPVQGYSRVTFFTDGTASIEFFKVDVAKGTEENILTDVLPAVQRLKPPGSEPIPDYTGKFVRVKGSDQYTAGKFHEKMLGANYRSAWAQPLEVPVLDVGKEKGGLKILQKGGGMQTLSLRLEGSDGHEYVLRSIEKFPESAVPEAFRKTFAQDLVQDQISAAHPYAALVVAGLADAAGIYHTNPKLVYIPDDPRLGIYRTAFKNTLALFEERPAKDWSDAEFFGNSKDIVNTPKVLEKMAKDNDNRIDELFTLRSRLFDLWISDWDRHDDQWRWASFPSKNGKGETFRPIPRDRDQAFFVNEGILPRVWSRKWALPKFEGFKEYISWPSGLAFSGRHFDRSFLTEMTEEQWTTTAKDLQQRLTDEVIERSIRAWPEELYKLHGEEVVRKLKSRRDKLVGYAQAHYKFITKGVDVVGSNKDEQFEVKRLESGDVEVQMFKRGKDGDKGKKLYERLFTRDHTKEIRLYGQGGSDKFEFSGGSGKSIKVRVIGGDGVDSLINDAKANGLNNKTLYYDTKQGNSIAGTVSTGNRTSNDPGVNVYDRKAFIYDKLAPLVTGNFNPDDGLFIGGGFLYQTQGFRKLPFKSRHFVLFSVAPRTNSYNLSYRGNFTDVFGKWGIELVGDFKQPNYVNNFFGWGNESVFNQEIDEAPGIDVDNAIEYYRYRFEELKVEALLTRRVGTWGMIKFGPAIQRVEVEEPNGDDRYINEYAATLPYELFNGYNTYTGVAWQVTIDKRNSPLLTTRGVVLNLEGRNMAGVDERADEFNSYDGSVSFYQSFRFPARIIFAARVGGGFNTGNYEFYQAQILGGRTNIRGFRKTRFYGDSKFYTNLEMRIKLFSFRSYIVPASMGILGFHDLGRVWYKDANGIDPSAADGKSNAWHKGWGGGLWFTPFSMAVLSIEAGHSVEGTMGYIRLGFLF